MRRGTARLDGILVAALAAIVVVVAPACQLFVDVGGLADGHCPPGRKGCNGACVSVNDPTYGCGSPSCAPCSFVNAYANCDAVTNACVLSACVGTYRDCSGGDTVPGCLTDIAHDPNNCSRCSFQCEKPPHGIPGCAAMSCAVQGCDDGYEDCNHRYDDGCETNLHTDPASCGVCGHACAPGQGCAGGVCASLDASGD